MYENDMEQLESLKFDFVEDNIINMLEPLKSNQNFLRYALNLNDFPLEQQYINSQDEVVSQPDFNVPYDLLENQIVFLTLFNPNILNESRINIFFSPLKGTSEEGSPIMSNKYIVDIVIPYAYMMIKSVGDKGKIRMFRIASEICKEWDNQYITGVGRAILYDWNTYFVNENYQGISLYFKVDDSAFTEANEE